MAKVRHISKRLIRFYYIVHSLTVIASIGFFTSALFTHDAEKDTIGNFHLQITSGVVVLYYVCSALLLVCVITGLFAHGICHRPALWVLYCILTTILVLMEFAGSATALVIVNDPHQITTALIDKMEEYNKAGASDVRASWDHLQIKYKCCGVNNYSDWQDVQFGMTSLTVPVSCCLLQFRNNTFCGQNMLPDHEKASDYISTRGCLQQVIGTIDQHLMIMGTFGLIISLPHTILVSLSCFLVITKKI